jgi:CRP-like cAMP-binding protein
MNIRELTRDFRERLSPGLTAQRARAQRLRLLGAVPIFQDCSDDELKAIDALGTQVDVPAGRVLLREGEPGQEFLLIVNGRAAVTRDDEPVAMVGPGSFVGEMALLCNTPRNATVTAASPMRIVVFNRSEFASLRQVAPHADAAIAVTALQRG